MEIVMHFLQKTSENSCFSLLILYHIYAEKSSAFSKKSPENTNIFCLLAALF